VDRYLREGYAEDVAARYQLPGERPFDRAQGGREAEGVVNGKQFTLVVGQTLFHSGKLSTRSKGLLQIQAAGSLGLNPADAGRLGIADGDCVRLSNDLGQMTTTVKLLDRVPEGLALFPEHFDEDARRLLSVATDPQSQVPYFKTTQVNVERVGNREA
jgi:formate dehydrogenase alpha subunit